MAIVNRHASDHLPEMQFVRLGKGSRVLLAFHGIAQNGRQCFGDFASQLTHHYTVYAFDLFFHGRSAHDLPADHNTVIEPTLFQKNIRQFLDTEGIETFDVAGFSIGGRFAMATAAAFPEATGQVFLMAPDGVKDHLLYRFATNSGVGRTLFRWFLNNKDFLFSVAGLLRKVRLLSSGQIHFAGRLLKDPERLQVIRSSWIGFRKFRFRVKQWYGACKKSHTEVWLFMGAYDQVIPVDDVKELSDLLPSDHFVVFACSHHQVVDQTAAFLADRLSYS